MGAELPEDVMAAALRTYRRCERLDMQALAAELGISRATLYRRAGSRQRVLGEVVWSFTRRLLGDALGGTGDLRGRRRVLAATERFMRAVDAQPTLRHFLQAEPECALRVLTDPEGCVHSGIVEAVCGLLDAEARSGDLELAMDPATAAYLIVRIGEGFLYADVIARSDRRPDLDHALEVIDQLLAVAERAPALG